MFLWNLKRSIYLQGIVREKVVRKDKVRMRIIWMRRRREGNREREVLLYMVFH